MNRTNLNGYVFANFRSPLEDLKQHHTHRVRREPEVTYYDEFAREQLMEIEPRIFEQQIEGWSRSFYSGEKHLQAILQYASPETPIQLINRNIWNDSVNAVRHELRSLPSVRAFSVKDELDKVHYEQSSAAGYGYTGVKGPYMEDNHMRAIRRAKATLYSAIAEDGEGIDHCIVNSVPDVGYTRTQLADITEKTKVRGVWGRAFHYILLEGTTARPLLETFQANDTFYQIGSDPTTNVPRLLGNLSQNYKWMYGIDWSSFDATVSMFEIDEAFDLVKELIDFPDYDTEQAFEFSRQLFTHKKIAAPDSKIYWSHKGIPSGSYYTSIIGSVVNRLRIEYLWRIKFGRGPGVCYTQGDDSLIGDDSYFEPEDMAEKADLLGWTLNPAKTTCSRLPGDVTFLGRTTSGGLNAREIKKCLRLLILPEYPVETGRISAYRAQSIYEDSGGKTGIIRQIADRLRRRYGIAQDDEVPTHFRKYYP